MLSRFRILAPLVLLPLLVSCKSIVMSPAGDVAMQQRDILMTSVYLMLIIIIPVMGLTAWFAWHYRSSNKKA